MGAATVEAMVSAEAPGYVVLIVTVGGAISGYCATGSENAAMVPASVMMIASTIAKTGRSMKKREKLPIRGLHRSARAYLHQVVDDHLLAFLQAAGDDHVGAHPAAGLHGAHRGLAVGADDHHLARLLALRDRGLRDAHRGLLAGEDAHLDELAGEPAQVRVGELGEQLERAGLRVDR